MLIGNIVRWDGSLWVVQEYQEKPKKEAILISLEIGNSVTHVTNKIDSVKYLAPTMKHWIKMKAIKSIWYDLLRD